MSRTNTLLILIVLSSAMYLVNVQYESRRLFSTLDKARVEAKKIQIEKELLMVQRREQTIPSRIEKIAKEKLKMRTASPAITYYVSLPNEAQTLESSSLQ